MLESHGLLCLFSISEMDRAFFSAAASSAPRLVLGVFLHLGGFCHLSHPLRQPGKHLVSLVCPDFGSLYLCRFFPALQPAFLRRAIVIFMEKKK